MNDTLIKKRAFEKVLEVIEDRQRELERQLSELQEALLSDTKSSAGDKHETSRAMTQLEQEKLGKQLIELNQLKRSFQRIRHEDVHIQIQLGSLIKTNEGWYYLCVPLGKVVLTADTAVFCLSLHSPLGQLFLGKTNGETITFNNREIRIQSIH